MSGFNEFMDKIEKATGLELDHENMEAVFGFEGLFAKAHREGLEQAAKWHLQQAAELDGPDRAGESNTSATLRRIQAHQHKQHADAIRALEVSRDSGPAADAPGMKPV